MRSTLDKLISGAGLLLVAVLLVAGGLLTWAHVFIDDQVHDQLAMQGITMPAKADLETQAQHDALDRYAGQQLTTGPPGQGVRRPLHPRAHERRQRRQDLRAGQRRVHRACPTRPRRARTARRSASCGRRSFMGDTLRGLLLYGYAFATMGDHRALRGHRLVRRRRSVPGAVAARDPARAPRRGRGDPGRTGGSPGQGLTPGHPHAGRDGARSPSRPRPRPRARRRRSRLRAGRTSRATPLPGRPGQHDGGLGVDPVRSSRLRSWSGTTSTPRFLIVSAPMPRSRSAARSGFSR